MRQYEDDGEDGEDGEDFEPPWEASEDDEPDAAEEIERALRDCGQNAMGTWCSMAGTEHCAFRCLLHKSLEAGASTQNEAEN